MIPKTKISSTILEFGEPLFEQFAETPPIDALRSALKIVITVWNAHTLALPIWGEPHHLDNLKKRFRLSVRRTASLFRFRRRRPEGVAWPLAALQTGCKPDRLA